MKNLLKQFMLFTLVGGIGTLFHFAVLVVAVQLFHLNAVLSSCMGFIVGGVINYLLNYHFTFQSDLRHLETSSKFFTVAAFGLGLNTLIMAIATTSLHYLLSQIIATTVVLFWNFTCNRYWTFREVKCADR